MNVALRRRGQPRLPLQIGNQGATARSDMLPP